MPVAAALPPDEEAAEPFFLRRIMRGADLVLGTEAGDGSASFVMVMVLMFVRRSGERRAEDRGERKLGPFYVTAARPIHPLLMLFKLQVASIAMTQKIYRSY